MYFDSDLLSFMPAKLSTEPVLYPRVDWFDHHEENQSQEHDKNGEVKSTKEYVLYVAIHTCAGIRTKLYSGHLSCN